MKKITVTLSDEAEKIFNDICYSLPKPGTDGELCTQSDAINYALINGEEMLQAFDSGLLVETPKLPSEEEIKEAAARHEAAMRCEKPNIASNDWYFDYVNEDFEAGVEWVLNLLKSK